MKIRAENWWIMPSVCFGPSFMVMVPRLVDSELLQFGLTVLGLSMQTCANILLYRKVREYETSTIKISVTDPESSNVEKLND